MSWFPGLIGHKVDHDESTKNHGTAPVPLPLFRQVTARGLASPAEERCGRYEGRLQHTWFLFSTNNGRVVAGGIRTRGVHLVVGALFENLDSRAQPARLVDYPVV